MMLLEPVMHKSKHFILFFFIILFSTHSTQSFAYKTVAVKNNQLYLNGEAQPILFGAELQYFRLRGGYGPNVAPNVVHETWVRALSQMREAGMNTISFYIPWDFHEYAEGQFDFDGTADEDRDGRPDYPSRNVIGFLKLVKEFGFDKIMVRPGPYINAEWGFLGFGAIPKWFHDKYPDSHMRNSSGLKTKLYDYHNSDFLLHTQKWFQALHEGVLKPYLTAEGPIAFIQLDNETNFMWQSIYNHDYSEHAKERYRDFLRERYANNLSRLNSAHRRAWVNWQQIEPATKFGENNEEDRDWYRFQDWSIYTYLQKVRTMWVRLGVNEPQVMFTLAESYNALNDGLLPNYHYRNAAGKTGLMTVNLYPKTYESGAEYNLPFKSDLDVKSAISANAAYWGQKQEWSLGPEIHSGWWRGIELSPESRRQTYLTVLGHGLKAFYIYYFTEGYNWQVHWAREQVEPFFKDLLKQEGLELVQADKLPNEFWHKLQMRVDREVIVGIDVRRAIIEPRDEAEVLYFDAPLDAEARPRVHFDVLKEIGQKVLTREHSQFLAQSRAIIDHVAIVKDVREHVPGSDNKIESRYFNAEWSGGLLSAIMHLGYNPEIFHYGITKESFSTYQVLVRQDNGFIDEDLKNDLHNYLRQGGRVVNLLGRGLPLSLGIIVESERCSSWPSGDFKIYECQVGRGRLIQFDEHKLYSGFNSDLYAQLENFSERLDLLAKILGAVSSPLSAKQKLSPPRLQIVENTERVEASALRVIATARLNDEKSGLWVTVKSGEEADAFFHVKPTAKLLSDAKLNGVGEPKTIQLYDVREGSIKIISLSEVSKDGFLVHLKPFDSKVFLLKNN